MTTLFKGSNVLKSLVVAFSVKNLLTSKVRSVYQNHRRNFEIGFNYKSILKRKPLSLASIRKAMPFFFNLTYYRIYNLRTKKENFCSRQILIYTGTVL